MTNNLLDIPIDLLIENLASLYNSINNRQIITFQSSELLTLFSNELYLIFLKHLVEEIYILNNLEGLEQIQSELFNENKLKQFITTRGYFIPFDLCDFRNEESFEYLKKKKYILWEISVDLLLSRIEFKKIVKVEIDASPRNIQELKVHESIKSVLFSLYKHFNLSVDYNTIFSEEAFKTLAKNINDIHKSGHKYEESNVIYPVDGNKKYIYEKEKKQIKEIIKKINEEYEIRWICLLKRLDVTIECFLRKNDKIVENEEELNFALSKISKWRNENFFLNFNLWDIFSAKIGLLDIKKISSEFIIKSTIKSICIGHVDDRGGIPEGYTFKEIQKDVMSANISLQQKYQKEAQNKNISGNISSDRGSRRVVIENDRQEQRWGRQGGAPLRVCGRGNYGEGAGRFEDYRAGKQYEATEKYDSIMGGGRGVPQYENGGHYRGSSKVPYFGRGGQNFGNVTNQYSRQYGVQNYPEGGQQDRRGGGSRFGGRTCNRPPTNKWNPSL